MKTIEVTIYKFEELNSAAQDRAINDYSSKGIDVDYIYDDSYKTVKEFNQLFNLNEGRNSWLYLNTGNIEDSILELTGLRLQKYIYNNFGYKLFKGKYFGSLKLNNIIYHPRIRSKQLSNGKVFNPYYSGIIKENCCVLTGVCYDNDILQPIYDFLKLRNFDNTNFEDLLQNCYDSLKKSIDSEIEYSYSEESIKENIIANDYDFLSTGEKY
jgi:hypothetical protein